MPQLRGNEPTLGLNTCNPGYLVPRTRNVANIIHLVFIRLISFKKSQKEVLFTFDS
jgi:hypothetical protein